MYLGNYIRTLRIRAEIEHIDLTAPLKVSSTFLPPDPLINKI